MRSKPRSLARARATVNRRRLTEEYTYPPLGTTAHKQDLIAGENAVGGNREFAGSLGIRSVNIFD